MLGSREASNPCPPCCTYYGTPPAAWAPTCHPRLLTWPPYPRARLRPLRPHPTSRSGAVSHTVPPTRSTPKHKLGQSPPKYWPTVGPSPEPSSSHAQVGLHGTKNREKKTLCSALRTPPATPPAHHRPGPAVAPGDAEAAAAMATGRAGDRLLQLQRHLAGRDSLDTAGAGAWATGILAAEPRRSQGPERELMGLMSGAGAQARGGMTPRRRTPGGLWWGAAPGRWPWWTSAPESGTICASARTGPSWPPT